MKTVIYGGGTFNHVRCHLALAAPAFGTTARYLKQQLQYADLRLTRMASETSRIITNDDLYRDLLIQLADPWVKVIIMSAALCDYHGRINRVEGAKYALRLSTAEGAKSMVLAPAPKMLRLIKEKRPDIFVVGFKTTYGSPEHRQITNAENLNVDLVLANDLETRKNILVDKNGAYNHFQRKWCLDKIASTVRELSPLILFENDHHIVVDIYAYLKQVRKVSQTESFELALAIVQKPEDRFYIHHCGWDTYEDGVYKLVKKENYHGQV